MPEFVLRDDAGPRGDAAEIEVAQRAAGRDTHSVTDEFLNVRFVEAQKINRWSKRRAERLWVLAAILEPEEIEQPDRLPIDDGRAERRHVQTAES